MRTLSPTFVLLAAAGVLLGQDNLFTAAPPEADKALREAVSGFYQCMVDGRFRQAEKYVAEDTLDIYYNQEKMKISGFEIVKIQWADGFQKATAVTEVATQLTLRGEVIPARAPMATHWKLENGKWGYYVDASMTKPMPMGNSAGSAAGNGSVRPRIDEILKDPKAILNQLKVSKEQFTLKSYEKSADAVTVTNGMQGTVTVAFHTESIPGLTWTVGKAELGPGDSTTVTLHYDPPDTSAKPALKSTIRIEPFTTFVLPVSFDIPEDVKKQIPK